MKLGLLFLAGALILGAQPGPTSFDSLVDRYFDDYFRLNPSFATASGFHQPYDRQLEDYSERGIQRRIELSRKYIPEFEKLPETDDRDWMIAHLKADLLTWTSIHPQTSNPDFYSSGATSSIFGLISRSFAPLEERMADAISREQQIPQMLNDARTQLRNPPKIYTEVALEQLPGNISFFANDVPKAFASVTDQKLRDQFNKVNSSVVGALKNYQAWLKSDLLTRSNGDFRIGVDTFHKALMYEEMVDTPLDRLLEIGYADLRKNQNWLKETAKKINPNASPDQITAKLAQDHPAPGQLLQSFRDTFRGLITFIEAHGIIALPPAPAPIVEETPPFLRALTFASMDTPGPYEKVAKESLFNVTLPEKGWSQQRTEELMEAFNRGTIISTAIHEAYPGHFTELMWFRQVPSKVRKLIWANTNVEGWAHYTEQMMLDEGYGNNSPELRIGQLRDALLRDCRFIVGIQMHTGKMTFDQGVDFFVKEGYQSREAGTMETKRGTSDALYLYYTLGKLQILKLREDYRKKVGSSYSLQQFHSEFVKQGGVPIKLVRHAMLGDNSPSLQ